MRTGETAIEFRGGYAASRARVAWSVFLPLLALPALAVARLLPAEGLGLALRLTAATAVLLLPGFLIARGLALRGAAAALSFALTALALALTLTFATGASLGLALWVLGGISLAALPFAARGESLRPRWATLAVVAGGAAMGAALWRVAPIPTGDALFHLARVRKLEAFDGLSLQTIGEFADGGLHPGYAFPLWHGFIALVADLAGVDAALVFRHQASILAPLAVLVAYEAGHALFRSRGAALAVVAGQVGLIALAPGSGGAYTALALPATACRQLLVPAALSLVFAYVRERSLALLPAIAAAGLALALVHVTYAIFVCVPLAGYVIARALMARAEVVPGLAALGALAAPGALISLALLPVAQKTASHTPGSDEIARAIAQYPRQLDVFSETSYRIAPEAVARGGAIAVAALALIPLAALVPLRRWSAFVLGGSLAVLALTLTTVLFPAFADLVSISQARRAVGFVPFAFAFAGGLLVLASLLRVAVLPFALGAGIALQFAFPGDFGYRLHHGGPALITWAAVVGGAAAFALGAALRWPGLPERGHRLAALAAVLFVLPVGVDAAADWQPLGREDPHTLTPGLVRALRAHTSPRDVVFSDAETSYRVAATLPVYVAAAPPAHVADTEENRPYDRRRDAGLFLKSRDLEIPRRYGADWIVVDRSRFLTKLARRPIYEDGEYVLYRMP
ncbi:MAG: hypothetical protein ABR583_11895 [Gaiellaceae bacterium]